MPQVTTLEGLTPTDAVVGQYVYTVSHELGHALFDVLHIPLLGRSEGAADQFAAVHQAHAVAALGFIQIRRRDEDR